MTVRIITGDCLTVLPQLAAEGVRAHAVVCDPPYHLTSIVKRFGAAGAALAKVGATGAYARASAGFMGQQWDGGDVAFRPETWTAVMACMRPGAFLTAFASTRGYHRMVCAIEDAGFIIHPMLAWVFATGFPKATRFNQPELEGWRYGLQALKPAMEPICMAQVPMDGTGSNNWMRHGCGGLNIDACRVGGKKDWPTTRSYAAGKLAGTCGSGGFDVQETASDGKGRWPANVIHDGSAEVEAAFAAFGERTSGKPCGIKAGGRGNAFGHYNGGIPVTGIGDTGSASRFFFSAKADAADRAGSFHPTVKPTDLMRWIVQLTCPPGGLVLDPFAGTGSTGLAADQLGMDAILIEKDPTYAADARRKISADAGLFSTLVAE